MNVTWVSFFYMNKLNKFAEAMVIAQNCQFKQKSIEPQ